jgi:phage/plasmid-associated DNA primase
VTALETNAMPDSNETPAMPYLVPPPPPDARESEYYDLHAAQAGRRWPRDVFSWADKTPDVDDVHLNHMVDAMLVDAVDEIDWDVAVWWNTGLAEAARRWETRPVFKDPFAAGRFLEELLGDQMPSEQVRNFINRIPRTEKRALDHLAAAVGHIARSVDSIKGKPFRLYDPSRGVWVQEGEWFGSHGVTVLDQVDAMVDRFTMALNRAVDFMRGVADVLTPAPPKPGNNEPQQVKDAYQDALRQRAQLITPLTEAKALVDAIFGGKFRVMRSDLRARLAVSEDKWDSFTRWLVLQDGVVDLEDVKATGEVNLQPFSPLMYMTSALDMAWRDQLRNAGESEWERGVAKILPNPDVRAYLQKRYGAALLGTPGVAGKSMVWQYGPGDTAKSTLQECIAGERGVFAPYSLVVSSQALTRNGQRSGAGELFMAQARSKRFVIMSELPDGEMLDAEIVKRVTGGESVSGTAKYANPIRYYFSATLFMSSNHPPTFPPGDTALAARIHVVPFEHRFWIQSKNPKEWAAAKPEDRADENWAIRVLESAQERSAILRWVLTGLATFGREGGLGDLPEAMQEQREQFVADADPVATVVRALLGEETGTEESAWIAILSDTEWEARGLRNGDGVRKARVEQLIKERARLLGFGDPAGEVGSNFVLSARRMLHERGGTWAKIKIPGSRESDYAMTRMVDLA